MRRFPGLIQTVSAASDTFSQAIPVGDDGNYWIGVIFSGANVVGSLSLQASDDGVDWFTIPNTTQAVTASADHAWEAPNTSANFVRVAWDYTSGTGNITARGTVLQKITVQG